MDCSSAARSAEAAKHCQHNEQRLRATAQRRTSLRANQTGYTSYFRSSHISGTKHYEETTDMMDRSDKVFKGSTDDSGNHDADIDTEQFELSQGRAANVFEC